MEGVDATALGDVDGLATRQFDSCCLSLELKLRSSLGQFAECGCVSRRYYNDNELGGSYWVSI